MLVLDFSQLFVFLACHETSSMARLTAFVMRSFGLARGFVFIDPNVLQSAKDWLIRQQVSDGCFMQQGTLYHYELKVVTYFFKCTIMYSRD
jgi:hypothetical protein